MWNIFGKIKELKLEIKLLHLDIVHLKESKDIIQDQLTTIAEATSGIEYNGKELIKYTCLGYTYKIKPRKTVSETIQIILNHLKLEITETPQVDAKISLTKIKPTKP